MKTLAPVALALAALCAACAGPQGQTLEPVAYSEQAMMDNWMAFMTPGAAHKQLESMVGTWDVKVTMFNPDGSSQSSDGTSQTTWLMDGRFLLEEVHGSFDGMPFHGIGTTGYDNMKQRYVYSWCDNMGTGIMFGEGQWDPARRAFHFTGEAPDVLRGRYVPTRSTNTQLDANRWKAEMWGPGPDGREMKSMELLYTRRS